MAGDEPGDLVQGVVGLGNDRRPPGQCRQPPVPAGGAFITGGAEPQVATVIAVLPDGSQVRGGFFAGGGTKATGYIWYWRVTLPREDANLTVTLVFKDAGRVLGHLTTVPGKSPFPAIKR